VFGGSLEPGGRFCIGEFGNNVVSVATKMFSCLIYFVKKLYKFCIFNTVCKVWRLNAKKVSFPSTSTDHTLLLFIEMNWLRIGCSGVSGFDTRRTAYSNLGLGEINFLTGYISYLFFFKFSRFPSIFRAVYVLSSVFSFNLKPLNLLLCQIVFMSLIKKCTCNCFVLTFVK
jgi:hypothetical protein